MSIRLKVSIGIIIIILIYSIILATVASLYVRNVYYKEVQTRVRLDLNSANNDFLIILSSEDLKTQLLNI